jgi:hypothetical protein
MEQGLSTLYIVIFELCEGRIVFNYLILKWIKEIKNSPHLLKNRMHKKSLKL